MRHFAGAPGRLPHLTQSRQSPLKAISARSLKNIALSVKFTPQVVHGIGSHRSEYWITGILPFTGPNLKGFKASITSPSLISVMAAAMGQTPHSARPERKPVTLKQSQRDCEDSLCGSTFCHSFSRESFGLCFFSVIGPLINFSRPLK